jgi:hypothetical protein
MFSKVDAIDMGTEFANRLHAAASAEARGGVLDAYTGMKDVLERRTGGYQLTFVMARAFNDRLDELEPLGSGNTRNSFA